MPPIKKIVMWLVVIFLLYAIVTSPERRRRHLRLGVGDRRQRRAERRLVLRLAAARLTWPAGLGWTASSSATSSTARRSSSPCGCTGSTSPARSSSPWPQRLFAFWVDIEGARWAPAASYVHDLSLSCSGGGRLLARLDGPQLAARVVRRHRQALPALLRLHPSQGRDDAAAQGHRHDLRPLAARPHRRLRQVRAGVGRSRPGAVAASTTCRMPTPTTARSAPSSSGRAPMLRSPRGTPPQPPRDDDGPDDGGGPADARRMPVGRLPRARAAEPRRSDRDELPSPVSAPRVVVPQLEPARPARTWATPARSRSCACRATTSRHPLYPPPHWSERSGSDRTRRPVHARYAAPSGEPRTSASVR